MQKKIIPILILVIVILLGIIIEPYLVTRTSTAQMTDMPPGMMMKVFSLDTAGVPIPTVSFTIAKDSFDGWDLHVDTTNFTFTPQNINQAPVADEGHVHLYIDGKLTVLLGPWYHIDSSVLPPGKHTISVSLNANDHSAFSYQGQNIQSMQTFYVNPL